MTAMGGTRHLVPADPLPGATSDGLVASVRGAAAAELARRLGPARLFSPSEDDRALVWAVISERLAEAHRHHVLAGNTPLDQHERQQVARAVFDALLGLGPLERYLAGDDVEELLVNGHERAFVVRAGGVKERVPTGFSSEAELRAFAARTVAVAGRRLDEANPKADARLPDGSRLHVICPPLAPFTCLTIRRHRLLAHSIEDLLALGTLTLEVAGLLGAAVRAGLNLLISGGTGSGKTTTLNAIASQIPHGQRVVTIEETKELALERHLEDCIALESRFAQPRGRRRGADPGAGPPGAADAAAADHRGGGPRPRSLGHAERHELRARGVDGHHPRQLRPSGPVQAAHLYQDGRRAPGR
jgi:pilus assembly protein CpaF